MILAHLTVVVSAVLGWQAVTVQPSRNDRAHASFQRSLAGLDELMEGPSRPSSVTTSSMAVPQGKRQGRRCSRRIDKVYRSLDPDVVFALAELSWIEARRDDRWRAAQALDHYVDTVAYAYDYLFDPDLASGRSLPTPDFVWRATSITGASIA